MEFTDQYNRPIDRKKPPTIVYAKTRSIKICIHNYAGCGHQWFLSAHELGLDHQFSDFEGHNRESHKRLWEHNDKQDQTIQNHENRISILEGEKRNEEN